MKIVGLTGGIGSGKSTVASMFADLGIPVYDSDREAKKLMGDSQNIKRKIVTLLGEDSYRNGELDRAYIAQLVFKDAKLLQALNAIVHPAVREDFADWTKKQRSEYVIREAAIIFENGTHESYDYIILVTAPLSVRIKRVVARDGVDSEKVRERIRNQWEDTRKIALADFVIVNSDLEKTAVQVSEIHRKLLKINP
ncbi:MAG TPA: dephospho-CoA kinase [Arenibacter sp.]|nr:dephospho-CoA kinase [Arenibacter sp.]